MGQIGEILRKARLDKGMSLQEAENETKIRVKYLAALEEEDFVAIPGRVYTVGFLRTYARFLGLDDQQLVSLYQGQTDTLPAAGKSSAAAEAAPSGPSALPKPRKSTRRIKAHKGRLAFVLILALVLLAAAYFLWSWSQARVTEETPAAPLPAASQDVEPAPEAETDTAVPEAQEAAAPQPAGEQAAEELAVTVTIKSANCWLAVTIDGKADFSGTLAAGKTMTFRGQDTVRIKFGNAGVAAVTYLGKTLDPVGQMNQVVTREFSRAE